MPKAATYSKQNCLTVIERKHILRGMEAKDYKAAFASAVDRPKSCMPQYMVLVNALACALYLHIPRS